MNDTTTPAALREQATSLRLHGLLEHWGEVMAQPDQARWMAQMLAWEATERSRRSLERRLREAHIGRFKPLADFDWAWPKQIDRSAVEELMTLDFVKDASNVVLVGPNGVGKSMCACNIGYQAVLAGHTALFTTAGQLLGELAALDSDSGQPALPEQEHGGHHQPGLRRLGRGLPQRGLRGVPDRPADAPR